MLESRALLLSIRPAYAEAILAGHKTVELRRRRVAAGPGTRVLIYATRPTAAIVGVARLRASITCPPGDAWAHHAHTLGIAKQDFDDYLLGSPRACLLLLGEVVRIEPVLLESLRSAGEFRPPQSYRYVSDRDPDLLHEIIVAE